MKILHIRAPLQTRITAIVSADIPCILGACAVEFQSHGLPGTRFAETIGAVTDWRLSRKATIAGRLAGFYLFCEGSVLNVVHGRRARTQLGGYAERTGIEGIALVVLPEFRDRGLGERLRALPKTMGYDYVFAQQPAAVPLHPWLTARRVVDDRAGRRVTLEDL